MATQRQTWSRARKQKRRCWRHLATTSASLFFFRRCRHRCFHATNEARDSKPTANQLPPRIRLLARQYFLSSTLRRVAHTWHSMRKRWHKLNTQRRPFALLPATSRLLRDLVAVDTCLLGTCQFMHRSCLPGHLYTNRGTCCDQLSAQFKLRIASACTGQSTRRPSRNMADSLLPSFKLLLSHVQILV